MVDKKFLGLQRGEFEVAERVNTLASQTQFAIFVLSLGVLAFSSSLLQYLGSVINVLLVILWQYRVIQYKRSHSLAERARRMVLLSEGLGIPIRGKQYSDVMMQFSSSGYKAKRFEDPYYYKAEGNPGEAKLAMMLLESAFWSKHLFNKSATIQWAKSIAALVFSLIGFLALPLIENSEILLLYVNTFCLLLIWLITGGTFSTALQYSSAERVIDDIKNRLEILIEEGADKDVLLLALGDYNAVMQATPIIPTYIYLKYRDRLKKLWKTSYGSGS